MAYESEEEIQIEGEQCDGEDVTFELIRKVEGRPFLFNSRDPKHSKRDAVNNAWAAIAADLSTGGKPVNGSWCKKKWKGLRDYYYKVKRSLKGKSGDGASEKKSWTYFSAMDRVLSAYSEENDSTKSNFPADELDGNEFRPETPSSADNRETNGNGDTADRSTWTKTPVTSKKRKSDSEDLLNEKILKALEEPEEEKDQFYHFGMTICKKLRTAPPQMAEYAMIRISSLLYEIMYSAPTYNASSNESNNYTNL